MKKLRFILLPLLAFSLISCGGASDPSSKGSDSATTSEDDPSISISINPELEVTVNFYVDYNQIIAKEVYSTVKVKNGSKLTKPADPSPIFPEFSVFKGWSMYEIVDDTSKLWNFDTDVVQSISSTFNIFGIWVAEGE